MKDLLLDLKIEIEQLEKQSKAEWLELKKETIEKLSSSWLNKLFGKKTNTNNLFEAPLNFIIKEVAEYYLDQTDLSKSKSKWTPLLHYGLELILPKIINAIIPSKD